MGKVLLVMFVVLSLVIGSFLAFGSFDTYQDNIDCSKEMIQKFKSGTFSNQYEIAKCREAGTQTQVQTEILKKVLE